MPSAWTLLWFGWGVYFLVVEGMALANSTSGDTLSEHVWAWLGIRRKSDREIVGRMGSLVAYAPRKQVTWRTWLRRFVVVFFLAALALHFLIGSNTVVNTVLAAAGIALGVLVAVGFIRARKVHGRWRF